jgi:signal peptidase I
MRPKLKTGDLILVRKNSKNTEHWGVYLKYDTGVIHYIPAQSRDVFYCTFKDIVEARASANGEKLK